MNFQKLKNNQNSKETIKLTQIHGTWYVYSIGTPTHLKTKKNPKNPPLPGEKEHKSAYHIPCMRTAGRAPSASSSSPYCVSRF